MINVDEEISLTYLLDPAIQLVNTGGKPLTDGWLEVYIHGTRNKYYCYSDWNGSLHPFKIPLDSLGSNIVLASPAHAYDIYVYNKFGSLIMSRYNIVPATGDGTVIKDVVNIKSEDGTVTVRSSDQTDGVQYDLSVNTGIIATKESVESSLLSKQDALTPGSNIDIANNIISATGIPTKTSELENDSGFITDVSSTVDITNIVGTISAPGNTIVNILYNSTLGLINMTTFNNPNRVVSGDEFYQIFLFNNDFTSKVDLKLQTEIRVRDDNYNSYFTVIYIDTTGTITEHGYRGIYLWPVHKSWKVLPGNTKYFFLSQQANNELNQYVNAHL